MIRPFKIAAVALIASALVAGVAYAAPRTIPAIQSGALQNPANLTLPGDAKALEQALSAKGSVTYKLLVIDSTEGEDKTAYLNRVAAEWGQPAPDTLLLVIYTADNYDLRFYMGANFRKNGVNVDEMLKLVRGEYFSRVHQGDVAGGLVSLISAVNARMGTQPDTTAQAGGTGSSPTSKEPVMQGLTVADPFGGPRHTAAGELEIAKGLLTAYLSQFKDPAIAESSRLKEFRWDDNKLVPIWSSDDEIEFRLEYDVLPAAPNTSWLAGNGTIGEGGWIVGTLQFMSVQKVGDKWELKGLSTSPKMRTKS